MQYRKGLHQQYRHTEETHPVSKIGPLSARLRPLAPLDGCATMYEGFLYEYQNFMALGACRPEDCSLHVD